MTTGSWAHRFEANEVIERILHISTHSSVILEQEGSIHQVPHTDFIIVHSELRRVIIFFLSIILLEHPFHQIPESLLGASHSVFTLFHVEACVLQDFLLEYVEEERSKNLTLVQ